MKPDRVKNFEQFRMLEEKKRDKYDYGCAMLYFDLPEMKEIHGKIANEDLYTEEGSRSYGVEKEPHVTLLYGLHQEVEDDNVLNCCSGQDFKEIVLENVSCFENEKYDVLKFDVKGKSLHECNEKLTKLPHTTDYPDYHPHSTIAYLKKGKGKKYIEMMKELSHAAVPHSIVYSKPDGSRKKWRIEDLSQ
jgi:2'-5' RNA ligase